MAALIKEVSKITAKGQTTVPKSVRKALGVEFGDRIVFCIDEENVVSVHRESPETNDPVIEGFLAFLARDMEVRPEAIKALPAALEGRMAKLTKGMTVDLDAPIDGEVDL